ncbi:MAG: NADH-quinone oxidoreductase subunit C [Eubacterium sp.]|nr:NADH-quinone oxidoreductase subunit C [Eubacterium sp.]MDE6155616.1 NADH-quinone oxidoreductase subunit C [Eubacterium sp.]MDE6766873.1 NADH-quinone oxidoreductase subunit C [Eubacterium sp.]
MREEYSLETVDIPTLYKIMLEKQRAGYRLAQICATAFEGYNEVIYSVVDGYKFENYKTIVPIDTEINTISDFFPSAMLYENEMKELFDVKIKSINPDYDNKLYRIAVNAPFKKEVKEAVKVIKKEEEAAE